MRGIVFAALAAAFAFISGNAGASTISIDEYFSAAPNVFGSPSWPGYIANALNSLQNSPENPSGTPGTPTYYSALGGTFNACNVIVTSFNSWGCSASPAGAFANEEGERLHAGVVITDGGGTFDLANITFAFKSNDAAGNFFDAGDCSTGDGGSLCFEGDLSGTTLNGTTRIGLGLDSGGACDVVLDAGQSDTTQLCALYYVGVGNAEVPVGNGQGSIDDMANYINDNISLISNQYCVTDDTGNNVCGTASVANAGFVPEPASLPLFGAALFGLVALRRLKRGA